MNGSPRGFAGLSELVSDITDCDTEPTTNSLIPCSAPPEQPLRNDSSITSIPAGPDDQYRRQAEEELEALRFDEELWLIARKAAPTSKALAREYYIRARALALRKENTTVERSGAIAVTGVPSKKQQNDTKSRLASPSNHEKGPKLSPSSSRIALEKANSQFLAIAISEWNREKNLYRCRVFPVGAVTGALCAIDPLATRYVDLFDVSDAVGRHGSAIVDRLMKGGARALADVSGAVSHEVTASAFKAVAIDRRKIILVSMTSQGVNNGADNGLRI